MKNTATFEDLLPGSREGIPDRLGALVRKGLLAKMKGLRSGRVEFIESDGQRYAFGPVESELRATIEVTDPRFYALTAFEGSVGAGEAYILGYWKCSDLTALVRIFTRDREVLEGLESGLARITQPLLKLYHRLRKNSLNGSSKNIRAHYDLGNAFFQLFLDPTMTYSCGVFESPDATLEQASIAKYERVCAKLDLKPGLEIIEIGSGWGGFARYVATTRGCRLTTTTLSQNQYDYTRDLIQREGLTDRVSVVLQDYRQLTGQYDRLVSIEMIEAVGHDFYPEYFRKCASLLKPDGLALIQSITIRDAIYEEARQAVDFIQRFIFPGSCIPSLGAITRATAEHTDLDLTHLEDITPHYARTLRAWWNALESKRKEFFALGYPEEMLRMWEFYFKYCEGGFLERNIGTAQLLFAKPGWRGQPPLVSLSAEAPAIPAAQTKKPRASRAKKKVV